jgi:hypothetical protein
MKIFLIPIAVLLLFLTAWPLFSELGLEVGLSATPIVFPEVSEKDNLVYLAEERNFEFVLGFHFGYSFLGIGYLSWDALVMPPEFVYGMTVKFEKNEESGELIPVDGFYEPGFINLFDGGVRFTFEPVVLFAEAGFNYLYVHKQAEYQAQGRDVGNNIGMNLRIGGGARFDILGAYLSLTMIFPDFAGIGGFFDALGADDVARDKALASTPIVPSLIFLIYL